jgi:hypothetical protein
MNKLCVELDVNGQFNASVHILHHYCYITIPIKFYI